MNTSTAHFDWPERRTSQASVLDAMLETALELAREGREGRCVGTIFVVGDPCELIPLTRCLILDPLHGHDDSCKHISDPEVRETLKELSQIDGAFIISTGGVAVAAGRYLDVPAKKVHLHKGLGSRHMAAAAITLQVDCVAIVVSASAVVRIFEAGECQAELK
jgi:DNA integrity scanning protein DisA with diadenylate cyclase activity